MSNPSNEKEELLLQAVKTQHSILQLLDSTLLDIFQSENRLPKDQQNSEVLNLAYLVRNIVAKKPKLKDLYRELEEDYGVEFKGR
ncbi:hypothetical protein GH741_17455 [Aquibacillus halophilus]|uniref:Uncharacterized protein n=1 Tax=Aquibacillus halophilus TaxID=930132 RepID=A0A6A8DFP1_9BACI|nr:hypothetical protein [Aquibacillus halophilus]MRH44433.1 hypothetical protein [Aquibacillus halophilus]